MTARRRRARPGGGRVIRFGNKWRYALPVGRKIGPFPISQPRRRFVASISPRLNRDVTGGGGGGLTDGCPRRKPRFSPFPLLVERQGVSFVSFSLSRVRYSLRVRQIGNNLWRHDVFVRISKQTSGCTVRTRTIFVHPNNEPPLSFPCACDDSRTCRVLFESSLVEWVF